MKFYFFIALLIIFSACSTRQLILPYDLRFGMSRPAFIDSMSNNCNYFPCDHTNWERPADTIKYTGYNNSIMLDSQTLWYFSGYFFKNRLIATVIDYSATGPKKVNFLSIYDTLKTKYGEPQDSAGFYGKEWAYNWVFKKKYIRIKIKREDQYGDWVVLEYVRSIKPASFMEDLEDNLKRTGPMKYYLKAPLNLEDYKKVLSHYRKNGQDTSTLYIDLSFNRKYLKTGFQNIDSMIITDDAQKKWVVYPDSLLQDKFTIHGVPFGVYNISLKNTRYFYDEYNFKTIVCTACENNIKEKITLYEKDTILDEDLQKYYDFYGYYEYDERAGLSYYQTVKRDFSKYLTDEEVKKLSSKNFIIKAYYLKKTGFSDIIVKSSDLTAKELDLVLKGFSALNNWKLFRGSNEAQVVIESSRLFAD